MPLYYFEFPRFPAVTTFRTFYHSKHSPVFVTNFSIFGILEFPLTLPICPHLDHGAVLGISQRSFHLPSSVRSLILLQDYKIKFTRLRAKFARGYAIGYTKYGVVRRGMDARRRSKLLQKLHIRPSITVTSRNIDFDFTPDFLNSSIDLNSSMCRRFSIILCSSVEQRGDSRSVNARA